MWKNEFLGDACTDITLPAIESNQHCVLQPRLSQVVGLLILPCGVAGPNDWTQQTDMEGLVDNTVSDNSAAKWLIGKGGVNDPEPVEVSVGKVDTVIARRIYSMEFELSVAPDTHYTFIQKLQRQYNNFNFWFGTLGGRVIGGPKGIKAKYLDAFVRYGAGEEDTEIGIINLEWWPDGEANRTDMPGLFGVSTPYQRGISNLPSSVSGAGANAQVNFYADNYEGQVSRNLSWTKNSGDLPASNTRAQILVFQNGQKLEETVQYAISYNTGPGESTITIDSTTHYNGANYEVLVFEN